MTRDEILREQLRLLKRIERDTRAFDELQRQLDPAAAEPAWVAPLLRGGVAFARGISPRGAP